MSLPAEVIADSYAEILSVVYHFKGVTMEPVFCLSLEALIGNESVL